MLVSPRPDAVRSMHTQIKHPKYLRSARVFHFHDMLIQLASLPLLGQKCYEVSLHGQDMCRIKAEGWTSSITFTTTQLPKMQSANSASLASMIQSSCHSSIKPGNELFTASPLIQNLWLRYRNLKIRPTENALSSTKHGPFPFIILLRLPLLPRCLLTSEKYCALLHSHQSLFPPGRIPLGRLPGVTPII